ncbi:MAG: hypothetical protein JEZ04_20635 [Spirochaetales bacterium]|nr:hypothetical protein [Spirochaetales bacterium]
MNGKKWEPLAQEKLDKINELFLGTYPEKEYGDLGRRISAFWIELLRSSWEGKDPQLKALDLSYNPADPLSRVEQKTTVIAYADSISREGEESLKTLDDFFRQWFPAVGGLHILPACTLVEDRFNDGYFSQVERDNIHRAFGTNELFADIMHRYFSMNDLVLGHVDIENPVFKDYLSGNDEAGRKFYTFTIPEYEKLKAEGSFNKVFRPRPFPLFTIFRRLPETTAYKTLTHSGQVDAMENLIIEKTGHSVETSLLNILYLFDKIQNDQMLLDDDYQFIPKFIDWLEVKRINKDAVFRLSMTQEVQHKPYIFISAIKTIPDLLSVCGLSDGDARLITSVFKENERMIFGEKIRALTTFSHVQVDVNTTTFEGLKALAEDLAWYLSMDLNMLRLDAVNYAFKKWGTSCFGLPELDKLMKIVYLSMEAMSPRMIPNLEVNDSLTSVLSQMSSGEAAPPMMHDFHLASLMPAVFHSKKPEILGRIFEKIADYDIPKDSIRFSLSESHDGKSVRGSLDLLTFEERMVLTSAVIESRGHVKYKSIPVRECLAAELQQFSGQVSVDYCIMADELFRFRNENPLVLNEKVETLDDIFTLLPVLGKERRKVSEFFFRRVLEGRDPYELCITTRDSLPPLNDEGLEAQRFLAFETLAFAVMGRNVKTIYFNDLLALPNDHRRVEETGELRNIKRTKVNIDSLLPKLENRNSFESVVARGINNLIALVDSDPALHFRGNEAALVETARGVPVAVIKNSCGESRSITVVNLSDEKAVVSISLSEAGFTGGARLYDNISGNRIDAGGMELEVRLAPFGRMWLSREKIEIQTGKLV